MRTRLKTLLAIGAVIAATLPAAAEEFKMGKLFDVTGPVKELKLKTSNKYAKQYAKEKFTENGKLVEEIMTYDADGYPLGFGMTAGNKERTLRIEYNDARQPVATSFLATIIGTERLDVTTGYDGDRVAWRQFSEGDPQEYVRCEYSDETRDEHGNWTSRSVKETTVSANPKKCGEKVYTETRVITYY